MKINLLMASDDVLSGYLNIDPYGSSKDKVQGTVFDLADHVDDGEATEIVATEVLEYIDRLNLDGTINNWISKLAHGGKLVIGGTELYEVCKAASLFIINADQTNALLYGDPTKPFLQKKNSLTVPMMTAVLKSKGLKVLQQRVHGFKFTVVGERP